MNPLNSTNLNSNSSGRIIWSGDCITCLGIKTGDTLDVVTYAITKKLCELLAPQDLSDVDLSCVIDNLIQDNEPAGDRTIVNMLQFLVDNDCKLKDFIDLITERINALPNGKVTLNLDCLGDSGEYTVEAVFNFIIPAFCNLKDDVIVAQGDIASLKLRVTELEDAIDDTEVTITTCLSDVPQTLDDAILDVADDYCEYKGVVGSISQVQSSLSLQGPAYEGDVDLNELMSSVTGWVTTPTTGFISVKNSWLIIKELARRLVAIEDCCAGGCDDIKIGFITSFEGDTVLLQFTSGAGTKIPTGFTDCGSILTITNALGTSFSVPDFSISQNGEFGPIDLSSFTKGEILDFNIQLKMCSDTETCEKCINKSVKYVGDECCTITNTSEDNITIFYNTTIS